MAISPVTSSNVTSLRDLADSRQQTRTTATETAGSTSSAAASSSALNAKQSQEVVDKAATKATETFKELDQLRQDLAAAAKKGDSISQDEVKALNDRLTKVKAKIDQQAADAKVGNTNLLSANSGTVTATTSSGDQIKIKSQPLDSKALGLDKLEISDAASLRKAAGATALATGQTQNAVYSLQAASGTVKPQQTNPGVEAFQKAAAARDTTPAPGSAAAAVQQALDNQKAVNTYGYGSTGRASSTKTGSVLDLFA